MLDIKYAFRALRYRYLIDPPEIRYLLQNLKAGDVAVDVGCHKGGYLYWMRQCVGKRGKVFAFEPQPKPFSYLLTLVGGDDTIVLENQGLSDTSGKLEFFIPVTKSGSSPGARIGRPEYGGECERLEIAVATLDAYFLERDIAPKLIKIDVEGHELNVLKGGSELLTRHHPRILMECESRHLGSGAVSDVFDFLLARGYRGSFFQGGVAQPIALFNVETHQRADEGRFWEAPGYVNNFVFEK